MVSPTLPGDPNVSIEEAGSLRTMAADGSTLDDDGAPAVPTKIGRHVVEGMLGSGGMGVVFAAWDPELRRRLAIKLVHRIADTARDVTLASGRMKREAQAMAKLNHRNVISVYDVGEHDEQLFIAMEYVEGASLRGYVRASPAPPWQDVLDVYLQAGEGLAAAHQAGLVHRDFKPENAMRGEDGIVRVLDFGLAQPAGERLVSELEPSTAELSAPHVTRTGAMVGTPAYMAPEQFEGTAADERSDQFSYCVALWEALYGERPFPGSDLAALAYSVTSGEMRMPPSTRGVPKTVRRALLRGLANKPDERWPSMRALLDALRPKPARRRWLLPAAVAVALGSAAVAAFVVLDRRAARCSGGEESLQGVWDGALRDKLTQVFSADDSPYAQRELERTSTRLDAYAKRWRDVHLSTCEATRVHATQSEEALDREMACLHERRARLRALVGELTRGEMIDGAAKAVTNLPSPESCGDLESLEHVMPVPNDPALAQTVAELRERLADARAIADAGRLDDATTAFEALLAEAEAAGFDPLTAEVLEGQGSLLQAKGDRDPAKAAYERAFNLALGTGHDAVAHSAASGLMFILAVQEADFTEGRRWLESARATLRRAKLGPVKEAILDVNEADILLSEGKFSEAAALAENARNALLDLVDDDDGALREANAVEAMARARLGELAKARELFERNVELAEALGPGHPELARSLVNLGVLLQMAGELAEARATFERALPMIEANVGTEHASVASVLNNLGGSAYELKDFTAAKAAQSRALEIRRKLFGDKHPAVAQSLQNLGNAVGALGDDEKAVEYYRRSIEIRDAVLGPEHPVIASTLSNLSNSLARLGRGEQALAPIERAIAIREKALGPESEPVAYSLTSKGEVLLTLERYEDAIAPLERALKIRRKVEFVDPALLAATEVSLSRALYKSGRDQARAKELALSARRELERADTTRHGDLVFVDEWLEELGVATVKMK